MSFKTKLRVEKVLERMIELVKDDDDYAIMFSEGLEEMLNDIYMDDGFGTEGQCDPRGDFRNDNWSMNRVEGVDPGIDEL